MKKPSSPILSILVSIVIPAIILSKFSDEAHLGVLPGFIIALAFPIALSLYELISQKQVGFIAIIGLVSIFCTGIIGVLELPSEWMAYKEAAVPLLIGTAVVVSLWTPYPFVKKLFYNEEFMDIKRIDAALDERGNKERFEKVLNYSTYMIGASFLLSAILNFTLTKIIVQSPSGTEAFNQELGRLTALSYPAIALPSTLVMFIALWYLFKQTTKLTGLEFEELLSENLREKTSDKK